MTRRAMIAILALIYAAVVLPVPAANAACGADGCPPVRIAGVDHALAGLVPAFLEAWAADAGATLRREGRLLTLTAPLGPQAYDLAQPAAGDGIALLLAGRADLVLSNRAIAPEEAEILLPGGREALRANGLERVVALDPMAVVAAPRVGVRVLPQEALTGLLSGQLATWDALGGQSLPVLPI